MKKIPILICSLVALFGLLSVANAYTVIRGDSMWKIAQRANLSLPELINLNPQVANPSLIYPGQEINIGLLGSTTSTAPTKAPSLTRDNIWTGNQTFSGSVSSTANIIFASSTIDKLLNTQATSTNFYAGTIGLSNGYETAWGSKRVYTSLIPVTLENSNTLTTLYSFTLPGNSLGTGNLLHIKMPISDFDYEGSSSGGGDFNFIVVYDDTTILTTTFGAVSDGAIDDHKGLLEAYISASSSAALQKGYAWVDLFERGATDGSPAKDGSTSYASGTAAEDSTTAKTVYIKAKWAAADSASSITTDGCFVELIR